MSLHRADYLYLVPPKFNPVLIFVSALLIACIAFLARVSIGTGVVAATIFVPIIVYGWMDNQRRRSRATRPALSLLDTTLEIPETPESTVIAYSELKSIMVETGRGYKYFMIRFFKDGCPAELTLDALGLIEDSDGVLSSIAVRVPRECSPRLGKGVLFCSPKANGTCTESSSSSTSATSV